MEVCLAASSGEDHGSTSVTGGRGGNGTVPVRVKDQIRVRVCFAHPAGTLRNPVQDAPSYLWMASALFDLVSRNAMLRGLMSLPQWWALAAVRADVLWPTFRFLVGT